MNTILAPPDYVGPDGSWDAATPCSAPVFSSPIPRVNENIVLRQDFQIWNEDWSPLPLSDPHPDYPDFLLAEESERVDISGGAVKWTRTYAKIPASHSDYSTFAYNFIAYYGTFGFNVASPTGRSRFVRTVNARIDYDYFLRGDPLAVPISAQGYVVLANGAPEEEGIETNFLIDAVEDVNIATTPSRSEYQALIAADEFNIVVQDSSITDWMGYIVRRSTIYVKAR